MQEFDEGESEAGECGPGIGDDMPPDPDGPSFDEDGFVEVDIVAFAGEEVHLDESAYHVLCSHAERGRLSVTHARHHLEDCGASDINEAEQSRKKTTTRTTTTTAAATTTTATTLNLVV